MCMRYVSIQQLSDIQYARFQILPVDLHFGHGWSAGIPHLAMVTPLDHNTHLANTEHWSSVGPKT